MRLFFGDFQTSCSKHAMYFLLCKLIHVFNADGPILVHTTFGDLLRALDVPENLTCPSNLVLSREGFVVANFPGGHVVAFTANGNRLRHEIHNDHIQVISKVGIEQIEKLNF